jgi:uncharacterized protein YkwD
LDTWSTFGDRRRGLRVELAIFGGSPVSSYFDEALSGMVIRELRRTRWQLVVLTMLALLPASLRAAPSPDDFDSAIERSLFDSLNQERVRTGLSQLKWDEKLMQSARKHAQHITPLHMLTHKAADEPRLTDRIAATGLRFNASAENLAYATSPEDIHPGLMHSPGHRANILNPIYNSVGIGVVKAHDGYYAVQNFARVTSENTASQATDRFAAAINKARAAKGLVPARIVSAMTLHQAACSMASSDKLNAKLVPAEGGTLGTTAFTASEPEQIPENLLALSADPTLKALYVGACYMSTKTYPGGTYWFAVAY